MSALHDLADALHDLAPWRWMREDQLIGIRLPGFDQIAWISVMGAAGSHSSVALYLGDEALHRFNLIQAAGAGSDMMLSDDDIVALILEARQLQVNFTVRDELFSAERAEIKALGRNYRGENWPCFRSFRPGNSPMTADPGEKAWLALAIEQLLAVAPEFKNTRIDKRAARGERLVRESSPEGGSGGEWRDAWASVDIGVYRFPEPEPSPARVAALLAKPGHLPVQCHFQLLPQVIGQPGKIGVFPYLVMSVDPGSGMVLGTEILSIDGQSHVEMLATVPNAFLKSWERCGLRPTEIHVSNEYSHAVLRATARALGVPLRRMPNLPELSRAMRSMRQAMGL